MCVYPMASCRALGSGSVSASAAGHPFGGACQTLRQESRNLTVFLCLALLPPASCSSSRRCCPALRRAHRASGAACLQEHEDMKCGAGPYTNGIFIVVIILIILNNRHSRLLYQAANELRRLSALLTGDAPGAPGGGAGKTKNKRRKQPDGSAGHAAADPLGQTLIPTLASREAGAAPNATGSAPKKRGHASSAGVAEGGASQPGAATAHNTKLNPTPPHRSSAPASEAATEGGGPSEAPGLVAQKGGQPRPAQGGKARKRKAGDVAPAPAEKARKRKGGEGRGGRLTGTSRG